MAEDRQVVQALGHLQGTVQAQSARLDTLMQQWRHQDDAANDGRRRLYEKFEVLSNQVASSMAKSETMVKAIEEIRQDIEKEIMPTVAAFKMETAHRAGMFLAGKVVWGMILGVATIIGFILHELFQYLKHGTLPFGHN